MTFADRLAARVAERRSQLVLGLDPDPGRLWPAALAAAPADGDSGQRVAAAVVAHCAAVIDAAGPACVAAKLQLACFERLGPPGWTALYDVRRRAADAGLLVIADGKRGDVPLTSTAYGQALVGSTASPLGELPGLQADAFTANPLLGRDALAVLADAARAAGAGMFVLVRTSNPGAADVQDLPVGAEGKPLWECLAGLVDELDAGAVVGATAPAHLARMRELMPRAVFLVPGVGAQGGRAEDLAAVFAPGPAAGLVTVSRAIADAGEEDPAAAARRAAERLRDATWALAGSD